MEKKQLSIYRTFSTLHYRFESNQTVQVPIYPSVSLQKIFCNRPFLIENETLIIQTESIQTSSHAIQETESIEPIEIIIRLDHITWQSHYSLFKDQNVLFSNVSIHNPDNISLEVEDIKIIFRSTDQEFDPKDKKNIGVDIPTIYTEKIIEYPLHVKKGFQLKALQQFILWKHEIDVKEIYEINLMDDDLKFAHSYLTFRSPNVILPGHLEIFDRKQDHQIVNLGSIQIKLYRKDDLIKIHFPKNQWIPVKTHSTKSNHSFFLNKNHHRIESKTKNKLSNKTFVRYYINAPIHIKNASIEPSIQDEHYYAWDKTFEPKEQNQFHLEFDLEN
jgi:hypothetical protein